MLNAQPYGLSLELRRGRTPLIAVRNAFLEGLAESDRARFEAVLKPQRYAAGEPLYEAGSSSLSLFFPTSGVIGELVAYGDGKSALSRLVGQNGVVAAAAVLSERPLTTRAVALAPTEGWALEVSRARSLIRESPKLRAAFEAELVDALEEASEFAGCAACHRLDERLSSLLLQWRKKAPAQRIQVTHELLCQMLGAQRTTVTTMMRSLKVAGVIRTGRAWLQIQDEQELARRSCSCASRSRI